jgi:hypothetical protein
MRAPDSGWSIAAALAVAAFGLMFASTNWFSCTIFLIVSLGLAAWAFWPRLARRRRPAAQPVFVESEEFFMLDPKKQSVERKQLAQRLEGRITRGEHLLSSRQESDADAGPWELDRIGLYIWESLNGKWPNNLTYHVRHEFDLLERTDEDTSLMPLYYALESCEACVRQRGALPDATGMNLLGSIEVFLDRHPAIDTTHKVRERVLSVRAAVGKIQPGAPLAGAAAGEAPAGKLKPAQQPDSGTAYAVERKRRYRELTEAADVKLRFESLEIVNVINDSGDVVVRDHCKQMTYYGTGTIASVPITIASHSGHVPVPPAYDVEAPKEQKIQWNLTKHEGDRIFATVSFDPPIGHQPVSYTRTWTYVNAVYFNQRDRADAAATPADSESLSHHVRSSYGVLIIRVQFPERHFPQQIRAEALRAQKSDDPASEVLDAAETKWIGNGLFRFVEERVAELTVAEPLPGCTYRIVWTLPETDAEEGKFSQEQTNVAQELSLRMRSLVRLGSPYRTAVLEAFEQLAALVSERFGNDLRLRLYAYGRAKSRGGLLEVFQREGRITDPNLVTIGRTLAGRSFRRKSVLVYQSIREPQDPPGLYEPLPSELGDPRVVVAIAVPLLCPMTRGRRVAVLHIGTWTAGTRLIEIFNDDAVQREFGLMVQKWYANQLSAALGMEGKAATVSEGAGEVGAPIQIEEVTSISKSVVSFVIEVDAKGLSTLNRPPVSQSASGGVPSSRRNRRG